MEAAQGGGEGDRASFETGVPNLDFILGGGVPALDVMLVLGPAGSGKTTLSMQMAFHTARRGDTVLYVSTYSEPPNRLLRHCRTFAFYDESFIGKRLFVLSVYPLVRDELSRLRDALVEAVKERGAALVIFDGLMTLHDLHPRPLATRSLLYEMGATLSALGCTTVLTRSDLDPVARTTSPELTTSDAVLELGVRSLGTRLVRTVQVRKVRGRAPRLGTHALRIDGSGLSVFPRLESVALPAGPGPSPTVRAALGLAEVDAMMHGGPPAGGATLIAGAIGTGKTVASLHFMLEGARRGERVLYLGLRETSAQLLAKAARLGMDLEGAVREARVVLHHHPPIDLVADELGWSLLEALERVAPARLVIDGITELERALPEERAWGYMGSLIRRLHGLGVTSLILREVAQVVGPELDFSDTPMAALAENVILFRYVELAGKLVRILSVLKMADSECDVSIRQYTVTGAGLHVFRAVESAEGLLTGVARLGSERRIKRRKAPAKPGKHGG